MKYFKLVLGCLSLLVGFSALGQADALKTSAEQLEQAAPNLSNKKIAVLGFPYHDGKTSSGSTLIQERLTTYLAQNHHFEVIERHLLEKLLQENKLATTGVIDEKTSQELGKVLGVGAIVSGTLIDLGKKGTEVNARLIDTKTGKILAASQAKVETVWADAPVGHVVNNPDPRPARPVGTNPFPYTGPYINTHGKPVVQMAILLDTSNSMDGLIDQAKSQLWRIVNDLTYANRYGERPTVEVALFEYGNDSLSVGENYVRQVLPFTVDLDKVSEKLFALRTNGGSEYCGAVIQDAVRGLAWSSRNDVYKVMFIAGNEPFTQGPVPYRESIAQAARKGVIVNSIFCGAYAEGMQTQWYDGALAGKGSYLNIDQDRAIVAIPTPYDAEIHSLGYSLNDTYLAYGSEGRSARKSQELADNMAMKQAASGAMTERALAKAAPQLSSPSWDAVSMVTAKKASISDVRNDLPAELKGKSAADLEVYFKEKQAKRQEIQTRLAELNKSRAAFLEAKQREAGAGKSLSLDQAIRKTVREQAGKLNFAFVGGAL